MILYKLNSLYGGDRVIASFLKLVRKHRNEFPPYLKDPQVEKISDLAEQHFFIQSWLLKP